MKPILWALVGLLALVAPLADAQTLYRCKDAKGVSSYQQVPCATEKQEAGRVSYQRQPDRPHWRPAEARPEVYSETFVVSPAQGVQHQQAPRRRGSRSVNPMSADAEAMRRIEHMAGSREGRAMLRAMNRQPSPASNPPPAPPAPPPGPVKLRDQDGNTYTQPPGGGFARDDKTGEQCFVNGAFIRC